jgi:hypothetical protein
MRAPSENEKEETGRRRHDLRIQYNQLTSSRPSQNPGHSMKKKVKSSSWRPRTTIGRDLAISNFDGPGRVREGQSGTDGGALASFPHLRMQARRAGPTAASFSSHVSQGFPLQVLPRSAAVTTFPASPAASPLSCQQSLLVRMAATKDIVMLGQGDMAARGGHRDPVYRNLNAPRHGIAALLLGLQLPLRQYCTALSVLVEDSLVSTSISGFSRRTTTFCTGRFPAHCVLPLQDLAITAPSPCRVIRDHTGHHFAALTLDSAACRPRINAVKRAGAAWIRQTHHEQFPNSRHPASTEFVKSCRSRVARPLRISTPFPTGH